jgi:hypothetical protein
MQRFASLALCLGLLTAPAFAQSTTPQPSNPPAKHSFPKPKAEAAPGGGPGKVWVNTTSRVYHCFGDRYYGKTANGKYMSEADAKTMGAHASRGETCGK